MVHVLTETLGPFRHNPEDWWHMLPGCGSHAISWDPLLPCLPWSCITTRPDHDNETGLGVTGHVSASDLASARGVSRGLTGHMEAPGLALMKRTTPIVVD
jgi:hypothetical protein